MQFLLTGGLLCAAVCEIRIPPDTIGRKSSTFISSESIPSQFPEMLPFFTSLTEDVLGIA